MGKFNSFISVKNLIIMGILCTSITMVSGPLGGVSTFAVYILFLCGMEARKAYQQTVINHQQNIYHQRALCDALEKNNLLLHKAIKEVRDMRTGVSIQQTDDVFSIWDEDAVQNRNIELEFRKEEDAELKNTFKREFF